MKEKLKQIIITILTWEARVLLRRHTPKIVAITGSLGKTGTKDAVAAALSAEYSVRKSPKSFNSEFGLPLTILGLPNAWNNPLKWALTLVRGFFKIFSRSYEEVLVLEIGADKPGDIASVAKWLKADVVVITAVPEVPVHVEFYPTPEDVLKEKASLINALNADGVLITGSDQFVSQLENSSGETWRTEGSVASVVYEDGLPIGMHFVMSGGTELTARGILGEHQGFALAFALKVAEYFKVESATAKTALEAMERTPGRMRLIPGVNGSMIIDDSYNSSPTALRAALETLASLDVSGKKVAIIGDMRELGDHTSKEHRRAGLQAAHIVDELYTVGPEVRKLSESAIAEGLDANLVHSYQTHEANLAGKEVAQALQKGDVVLVKSSQGKLRLERAVREMMQEPQKAGGLLVRQEQEWVRR